MNEVHSNTKFFVNKKNKDPPIYALSVPIWAKDSVIKRNYGGPAMHLEHAQQELLHEDEIEEEEHLSIAQLRARRKRSNPSESIVPITVMGPKGKAVEVLKSKPQKKRKKSKSPVEVTQKGKTVVLSYVCSKNREVHLVLLFLLFRSVYLAQNS